MNFIDLYRNTHRMLRATRWRMRLPRLPAAPDGKCMLNIGGGKLARQYSIGLLTPTDDATGVAQILQRFMTLSADEQTGVEAAACAASSELAWPNATRKIIDYTFTHS